MKSLKDYAAAAMAALRNTWNAIGRLADPFRPSADYSGFRLARTGKHKDTCLTRHEQTRNPAGTKLWKSTWAGRLAS